MDDTKPLMENAAPEQDDELLTESCCCCYCQCTAKKTQDISCCCLVPARLGVILIGFINIALMVALFIDVGYGLLNEFIAWWYVAVGVLCLVPMIIAVTFFVVFYSKETDDSRSRLWVACQLTIISVVLLGTWNTVYFYFWYSNDAVYTGTSDTGYMKQTKRQFIVWQLYIATCLSFLFAYFLCVTRSYSKRLEPKKPKAAKMDASMMGGDMMAADMMGGDMMGDNMGGDMMEGADMEAM